MKQMKAPCALLPSRVSLEVWDCRDDLYIHVWEAVSSRAMEEIPRALQGTLRQRALETSEP